MTTFSFLGDQTTSRSLKTPFFYRIRNCVMLETGVRTLRIRLVWVAGRRCLKLNLEDVYK